jgi:hypothetical protein
VWLDREHLAWTTFWTGSVRKLPTGDVTGYRVERRGTDDAQTFLVVADTTGERTTVFVADSRESAVLLCRYLSEAMFVVLSPPPPGPYR